MFCSVALRSWSWSKKKEVKKEKKQKPIEFGYLCRVIMSKANNSEDRRTANQMLPQMKSPSSGPPARSGTRPPSSSTHAAAAPRPTLLHSEGGGAVLPTIPSHSSSATVEWVMSQGVMVGKAVDGSESSRGSSAHASFDIATMAGANTEVFYDTMEHAPSCHSEENCSHERVVHGVSIGTSEATNHPTTTANGEEVRKAMCLIGSSRVGTTAADDGDVGINSTRRNNACGEPHQAEDAETMSFTGSEEIGLASSAAAMFNKRKSVYVQRKQHEQKRVMHLSHEAVQCISSTAGGSLVTRCVDDDVVEPLIPNPSMLAQRHHILEKVCFHVTQALRFAGIQAHIAFYVFGSVHLRTVLPDGDIDITMILLDPSSQPAPYSIHHQHDGQQQQQPATPVSSASPSPPGQQPASMPISTADLLPKVRDYMLAVPSTGIFVDSLVFAEVRVLKLVSDGLCMDFTVGQTGGTSTVCFLHQVDRRLGNRHLFKRTLILLKAWANYEARVLSGHGGYLGTYALTVMLMAVMNGVLSSQHGADCGDLSEEKNNISTSSKSAERAKRGLHGEEEPAAEPSPLALALRFFAYYSTFDFETQCVTIYGPLPISALQRSGGGLAPTSAASTITCDLSECDERTGVSCGTGGASGGACGDGIVSWLQDSSQLLISEQLVADCASMFGRGSGEPSALTTPSASPLVVPGGRPMPADNFPSLPSEGKAADLESTSSHSTERAHSKQSCSKYNQRSEMHPQFSLHLLSTAGGVFPVRSMNIMDPLRPSSNLSRGVSRAHVFRIQAAMLHALQRGSELLNSVAATMPDSSKLHSTGAVAASSSELSDHRRMTVRRLIEVWLPNTMEVIHAFDLRHATNPAHLPQWLEELPEAFFGGTSKCPTCQTPSALCVSESYLRRPELIAIPPPEIATVPPRGSAAEYGFAAPPHSSAPLNHNYGRKAGNSPGRYQESARHPPLAPTPHHHHHHHRNGDAGTTAWGVGDSYMGTSAASGPRYNTQYQYQQQQQRPHAADWAPRNGRLDDSHTGRTVPAGSNMPGGGSTTRVFPSHLNGLPHRTPTQQHRSVIGRGHVDGSAAPPSLAFQQDSTPQGIAFHTHANSSAVHNVNYLKNGVPMFGSGPSHGASGQPPVFGGHSSDVHDSKMQHAPRRQQQQTAPQKLGKEKKGRVNRSANTTPPPPMPPPLNSDRFPSLPS